MISLILGIKIVLGVLYFLGFFVAMYKAFVESIDVFKTGYIITSLGTFIVYTLVAIFWPITSLCVVGWFNRN